MAVVFGILNVVFGGWSLVVAVGGALLLAATLRQRGAVPPELRDPVYQSFAQVSHLVGVILAILLCVAGIGLLRSRPWGRSLALRWVAWAFVFQVVCLGMWSGFAMPRLREHGNSPMEIAIGIWLPILKLVYPVLMWWFLQRPVPNGPAPDSLSASGPAGEASAATATPRFAAASPTATDGPTAPCFGADALRIFGVVSVLIGVLRFVNAPMNSTMLLLKNVHWHAYDLQYGSSTLPFYHTALQATFLLDALLSPVIVVAGMGLLRARSWGRWLSIGWAWCAIALAIAVLQLWMRYALPQSLAGRSRMSELIWIANGFMRSINNSVYPILLLFVMSRPAVRAMFEQRGGPDTPA